VPSLPVKVGVSALTCQSRSRRQRTRLPHAIVRHVQLTVFARQRVPDEYLAGCDWGDRRRRASRWRDSARPVL